ncbi:PREDICTED: filament-like plant protein 7 [Nicotiana attenuata]|uniref:Filament-like plant protein 7 n=1 Tax=Nicotiana attenuata TaxID=49451 RepID=A0A314L8W3_NICAT|nr:PREDICTED: filament-like plant protein 7 [Nicotiana attenuata]XP_019262081.1 PREDICTED: filament-like plant protein 7 [Nicotiana attenuata]XP_019262082.1 PREDICTED: filament-like plant protein 7 [Nicotiana attenuata]XP_019262083.1 PREDICTED: filament-like plant protein 7 [Nicotiana attenuata]OIT38056.1 filament-like plant protein 7 [Nicotiana attenuata]
MDHKSWPWKKKSSDKNTVAEDKANISSRRHDEELQTLLSDKAELERELEVVNAKLSSALVECRAKDDFAQKQMKIAQEAIAGWEKTETEARLLKQELEKALQQSVAGEERLVNLDAALKECMQQLRFVRDEQENRIHDAVLKASKEFEKTRTLLERKLADAGQKLSRLGSENTQLSMALMAKEKATGHLKGQLAQAEADFSALKTRLESVGKENASLRYEVRVLEKELEIRNEEREFNRRTADVSYKQHLESVKKIAKLDSECQRLRNLVRKRLPGPAALAKMKNEVEMLGKDHAKMRRRKSNPSPNSSVDLTTETAPDTPNRKINFLAEHLCMMDEENRTLKEALYKRTNELKLSRMTNAQTTAEPEKYLPSAQELSVTSLSDMGSDDIGGCSESWASALMSELEHFKNEKKIGPASSISVGASDINLMDDFAEMEKLAVESTDNPLGALHHALLRENGDGGALEFQLCSHSSEGDSRERIPVTNRYVSRNDIQLKGTLTNKATGGVDNILKMLLEHGHVTQRNPYEILADIKTALAQKCPSTKNPVEANESSIDTDVTCTPNIGECISQGIHDDSLIWQSSNTGTGENVPLAKQCEPNMLSYMGTSINKVIDIIEGINIPSSDDNIPDILSCKGNGLLPYESAPKETAYMVRVFQWKTSELSDILQEFIQTCRDLLNGKVHIEKFTERLTWTLEWIVNHCFSLQDVSSMKDAIKNHFDWDDSRSEIEMETGGINPIFEFDKLQTGRGNSLYSPDFSSLGRMSSLPEEKVLPSVDNESELSKDEFPEEGLTKADLDEKLQAETVRSDSLMVQLQESEKTIKSLQKEVEDLRQSKEMTEQQIEKEKMAKEYFEMQFKAAKMELNEACRKACCLEKELEDKNNSYKKLDSTCHMLQLQRESTKQRELAENAEVDPEEKLLQSDREITAASEKLAECQETILNLGKQLKALASPGDAALFDKVISTTSETTSATMTTPRKSFGRRSSLLDKMLAEDNEMGSPTTKEVILDAKRTTSSSVGGSVEQPEKSPLTNGSTHSGYEAVNGSRAIVPSKKKNGLGLWKKLLRKGKKNSSKTKLNV